MKIELSDETASNLVVEDLISSYELSVIHKDEKLIKALEIVLEYYMIPSEYQAWVNRGIK